jgi:twitching motility protein PilT
VGAVERLISVFPADEQSMIQRLLGMVLRCVIAQHLIVAETPLATRQPAGSLEPPGGTNPIQPANPLQRGTSQRALAAEIMWGTTAVGNLIASGQTRQIGSMIESGTADGMQTLDASLIQLLRRRRISEAVARSLAKNPNLVVQRARSR